MFPYHKSFIFSFWVVRSVVLRVRLPAGSRLFRVAWFRVRLGVFRVVGRVVGRSSWLRRHLGFNCEPQENHSDGKRKRRGCEKNHKRQQEGGS